MSCHLCHFPSGKGENIWEKFYVLELLLNYLAALLVTPLVYWYSRTIYSY
jgi:hypothetical protein